MSKAPDMGSGNGANGRSFWDRLRAGAYRSLHVSGVATLALRAAGQHLRILEYHGVCRDACAREDWMPDYFVSQSQFAAQMQYVARHTHPLPLSTAVEQLARGTLPPRATCVTFDDGYANNLHLALPILQRFEVPATIFVATRYVETQHLLPFIQLKLAGWCERQRGVVLPAGWAADSHTQQPIDTCRRRIAEWWPRVNRLVAAEQRDALRSLRVEEIDRLDATLIDLGAHTDTHCILSLESRERRRYEIERSVRLTLEWSGQDRCAFCYPRGRPGDFDPQDQAVLRALGVPCAVTTARGGNGRHTGRYALRRHPVGLHHDAASFAVELSGLRSSLLGTVRSG